ncbi:hypothetical protein HOY80DRAFT_1003234 [Tuber brumale]|nr:hypothetical protein HOY80DRAFT_1003234 [Tuber brumale]
MTTTTATISPAATMFLLPSHHHHHHHARVEAPMPSLTPPPQSPEVAVAEVEAEVEQFRRQLYLRRGLPYPGPKTPIALPRQNTTVAARQQYSSDEFPRKAVGLSPVATATVITGATTAIASTAAAVELKAESSSSLSPPPPITTASAHPSSGGNSGDGGTRLPKTCSRLMEDLIRMHWSTASPSGQKYSGDLLQGTVGHCTDAMFGGGTYFGSFT